MNNIDEKSNSIIKCSNQFIWVNFIKEIKKTFLDLRIYYMKNKFKIWFNNKIISYNKIWKILF